MAGFVAAPVAATVTSVATVASDCVAGRFTDAAAVALAAVWTSIFVPATAAAAVAGAVAAVATAAPESALTWAADAAGAPVAAVLAAMAAAAIASGAVALPDDGEAAGTIVDAMATGITTATGVGVVAAGPSCCAGLAGLALASVAGLSLEDGFAVDFVSSVFEVSDFALERWAPSAFALASALALASASERCLAALRSPESAPAVWSAAEVSRDRLMSAVVDVSSERRCGADGSGARPLLLVSAVALLSTSAAKLSFPGG
ncbi:MAG TPA: hypothetical protein VN968_04155 [Bradyrhizobium sp.]|nr:hypothetical protein [Bradyrhizobium sp.]